MLELTRRATAAVYIRLMNARDEEEGQTLVEYALIIALVSIGLILALGAMRTALSGVFGRITSALSSLPSTPGV
jgi:pilus assembly protein Flp/PilA